MKNIKKITLLLLFMCSFITSSCFGQQRLSLGLDLNKFYPQSFMPDFGGNIDLAYSFAFSYSSIGIGSRTGFYWFKTIKSSSAEFKYYTIPAEFSFFRLFEVGNIDIELSGNAGINFLFGNKTFLKDTEPDWNGTIYKRGDTYRIGVWPAGTLGATCIVSKRIGRNDIGVRFGYKHIFRPPIYATDINVPDAIGAGYGIGFQVNRWFGKNVESRG